MEYYARLSQDAQQRQMRAVWQSQRLALNDKRRTLLIGEGVGREGGGGAIEERCLISLLVPSINSSCGRCCS